MVRYRAIALVPLAMACHGSMSSEARMSADLDSRATADVRGQTAETDRPLSEDEAARARAALNEEAPPTAFALFGARHDFSVKDASGGIPCRCVSVLLGPPSSGKLAWQGEMPKTKPETQLMLALIPDDSACAGADNGRASYWGYRIEGNDVVVLLEPWKAGRPRTLGAIIPRPPTEGKVFLAPVSGKLPFGTAPDGNGRCALGNPGPKRTEAWQPNDEGASPAAQPSDGDASD